MYATPVVGDEPGDPVRFVVELHMLMSRAEIEMWESVAARCRVEVDDVVHVAALCGMQAQLAQRIAR